MKISTRIVALVVVGFLVTLSVIGVAAFTMSRVTNQLSGMMREELPLFVVLTSLTVNQLEQAVSFEKALRARTGANPAGGTDSFEAQATRFADLGGRVERLLGEAVAMAQEALRQRQEPMLKAEFRSLLEQIQDVRLAQNRYGGTAQRIFSLLENGKPDEAFRLLPAIAIEQKNLTSGIEHLVQRVKAISDTLAGDALDLERKNVLFLIGVAAAGLVVCVLLGLAIGRSIARPIAEVVVALGELVRGNIGVSIDFGRIPQEISAIAVALRAFRDEIVNRRQTVTALAESERRFHSLAQVSPVGIFYTDPLGNCLYSNTKCTEITSLRETEMLGTGWQKAIHPDDRDRVLADWANCAAKGTAGKIEYRFLKRDGTVSWVIGQTTSHNDASGRVTGFVSTLTDVTEQKDADQVLRHYARSRGRLQDITVDQALTFEQKIKHVLLLGSETFNLPLGIVSRIEGESYAVEHVAGPEWAPPSGAVFALGETYCVHTLAANGPIGFDHVGRSAIREHPCYKAFGLEAYIGVPLIVDGRRYGTLNFSSHEPRERPFGEGDFSLIQLFGQWVGAEISRRRAEESLRISEERLKLALEGTEDGLWDRNVATGDLYVSPRWEAMLGFAPGEFEGRVSAWESRIHLQDREATLKAMNDQLRGRTAIYETEYRIADRDGGWLWVLDRGKVVERRLDGTPIRAVGTLTDITARKRAEDALRDSEERVRAVVDNVVDGIVTVDESGIIESVNPAVTRIFGFERDELIGQNVSQLMPEPHQSGHVNYIRDYIQTGSPKIIGSGREVSGQRKDGSILPLEIGISEINLGGRRMFTGIVRDITERKQIERMKNEFVSTVSHELRTPLTSIRGALGLITGGAVGKLPRKAGELVDIAYKNSQRLIALVNDILDLEKIESGRTEFRFQEADLGQVVRASIEANRGFAEEYGVRLLLDEPVPAAVANLDGDRMVQVMANLLSNAIKFSPSGETVAVTITSVNGWGRVAVADRGPGIPENFRSRIFQRFSQADSSDTRKAGGTGLGLSIAKSIIERHGGHIGFDSVAGAGTTFYFELPLVAQDGDGPPPAEFPADAARGEMPPKKKRILICEDDPDIANLLAMLVARNGMRADVALSAGAAQRLLASRHYDAMTVDLILPDKDGISLIRDLRKDPANRDMPVVVVSAHCEDAQKTIEASTLGVIDWLNKPIDEERLRHAVTLAASYNRKAKPRLLYVEDDTDLVEVVSALLGDSAILTVASTVAEARNCLKHEAYDLAILDVGMPDGCGLDLLKQLRGNREDTTPVIIFSGEEVGEDIARMVDAALVKARVSNRELLDTIRRLVGEGVIPQDAERNPA